ncbi:MAG TPA: SRPBCC domain-containing protein [Ktedonobacterales bacterium]|nr:SRPBCC domain-containing protein [Ktedonobacterales bacterium]
MTTQNYHQSITADIPPSEAFDKIGRVPEWWGTDFEGQTRQVGDVFTVRFEGGVVFTMEIVEAIPDKKVVWRAIESIQPSLKDVNEWTGTQIVWEISSQGKATQIDMTHVGLVPDMECYDMCKEGWDFLMLTSLLNLITENKGNPVGPDAVNP